MFMLVNDFTNDPRTRALFYGLILNLVLGTIAAIRTGTFDAKAWGRWWLTHILPFGGGYFIFYWVALLGLSEDLGVPGAQALATALLAPAVWFLQDAYRKHIKAIFTGVPQEAQPEQVVIGSATVPLQIPGVGLIPMEQMLPIVEQLLKQGAAAQAEQPTAAPSPVGARVYDQP